MASTSTGATAPEPDAQASGRRQPVCTALALLLLAGAVAVVYLQVCNHSFINFDDHGYITENEIVKGGLSWKGLAAAFRSFDCWNWHPLTWLAHMADYTLWGNWAGGHLLGNVLLHLVTTLLVFVFFRRHGGTFWPSFWVALVFGIHPAHVESIAWASEKKDVLCALLVMATLLIYGEYARKRKRWAWWGALGVFALALLAKPMAVTVPFLLLLLDFWPLRRVGRAGTSVEDDLKSVGGANRITGMGFRLWSLVWEKVPFFMLSGVSSFLTLIAQEGALQRGLDISLVDRVANSALSFWKYIFKMVAPVDLAFFYPYPDSPPLALSLLALAGLLAVTALLFRLRQVQPALLVGWLWFIGMLIPVIGLVQVGVQAMADRYTYLPSIGLSVTVVWGVAFLMAPGRRVLVVALAGGALCLVYAVSAHRQVGYWKDSETLYRRALSVNAANSEAWFNLAVYYHQSKRHDEAEACYRRGLQINPDDANGNYNYGVLLVETGRLNESVAYLETACRLNPRYAKAKL
ncbi:MAG TPA: tetratricopeptide repeat protein, partial [Acidobacteriota bacterium]|nr:tetratricopeptide repeat protein [Acidobacteriota bacterium]